MEPRPDGSHSSAATPDFPIVVRECPDSAEAARQWDEYVLRARDATSDHLWNWRHVLRESFGFREHYLGAFQGPDLVGVLPLFEVPRGLGRMALSSIPFGDYGGICADSPDAQQALLNFAKAMLRETRGVYLELKHRTPLQDDSLVSKDLHSRFTYPIPDDPQTYFLKGLGTKSRNAIRMAEKRGLSVVVSRDLGPLYDLHKDSFHRLGTPCFPRRYFGLILERFGEAAEIHYLMCQHLFCDPSTCSRDTRPVGFNLVLNFRDDVVCQFSGSRDRCFQCKPNNLLFWQEIVRGSAGGKKLLDYCRSRKDSGSATFKRRLEFHEEPLGYQYCMRHPESTLPSRNPSNPGFKGLIVAWQKLPLPVANVLGPLIVKYFA